MILWELFTTNESNVSPECSCSSGDSNQHNQKVDCVGAVNEAQRTTPREYRWQRCTLYVISLKQRNNVRNVTFKS